MDLDQRQDGAPCGKDSSLKTWKGDQWKIGGRSPHLGLYSYDPKLTWCITAG